MNSSVDQKLLKSNVRPAVWQLEPGCQSAGQWSHTLQQIETERQKRKQIKVLQQSKVQTRAWFKYCAETLRGQCRNKCLHICNEWINVVKKNGPKFLDNFVIDWWSQTENKRVIGWNTYKLFIIIQKLFHFGLFLITKQWLCEILHILNTWA